MKHLSTRNIIKYKTSNLKQNNITKLDNKKGEIKKPFHTSKIIFKPKNPLDSLISRGFSPNYLSLDETGIEIITPIQVRSLNINSEEHLAKLKLHISEMIDNIFMICNIAKCLNEYIENPEFIQLRKYLAEESSYYNTNIAYKNILDTVLLPMELLCQNFVNQQIMSKFANIENRLKEYKTKLPESAESDTKEIFETICKMLDVIPIAKTSELYQLVKENKQILYKNKLILGKESFVSSLLKLMQNFDVGVSAVINNVQHLDKPKIVGKTADLLKIFLLLTPYVNDKLTNEQLIAGKKYFIFYKGLSILQEIEDLLFLLRGACINIKVCDIEQLDSCSKVIEFLAEFNYLLKGNYRAIHKFAEKNIKDHPALSEIKDKTILGSASQSQNELRMFLKKEAPDINDLIVRNNQYRLSLHFDDSLTVIKKDIDQLHDFSLKFLAFIDNLIHDKSYLKFSPNYTNYKAVIDELNEKAKSLQEKARYCKTQYTAIEDELSVSNDKETAYRGRF